jgi:histidinol-phosphate aminotransferase
VAHSDEDSQQPARRAVAAVRALAPYVPGKPITELERELGIADIVKLASNENPLGSSPAALAAARRALDDVWLYPDGSGHALKRALGARLGVSPAQITLGNGSNDVLVLLAEAFLAPGDAAVYSQYAFAVYPIAVQATGARATMVPALPLTAPMPLGHDFAALARAVTPATKLVFVANPNNPTGTWARADELRRFLAAVPRSAIIVLDEAYFEYSRSDDCGDGIEWLRAHPNLVVVRTFSKAYGLAGLRVGFAVSDPAIADVLNRVRQPFNVSQVGLAAAEAALGDQSHVERSVALAREGRARLARGLTTLGLAVVPSAGNFVLVKFGPVAGRAYDALLRRGLIVRPVANYGLDEYLRITIGTDAQITRLLAAVREILGTER